jgi:transcriptional regulator with XRE-family HTH domain
MAAKIGRRRGLALNVEAVEDQLDTVGMRKADLAEILGVSTGYLSDLLSRRRGANEDLVQLMAAALRCRPGTIAPEWGSAFVAIREADWQSDLSVRDWLPAVARRAEVRAVAS